MCTPREGFWVAKRCGCCVWGYQLPLPGYPRPPPYDINPHYASFYVYCFSNNPFPNDLNPHYPSSNVYCCTNNPCPNNP